MENFNVIGTKNTDDCSSNRMNVLWPFLPLFEFFERFLKMHIRCKYSEYLLFFLKVIINVIPKQWFYNGAFKLVCEVR